MSDDLAKRVRMALGPYDDPDRPITAIIGDLRDAIAKAERDVLMRQLNVLLHDMLWNPNVTSVGWAKRVKAMIDEARNTTQSAEEEYLDIPAFERRRNPPKVDSHPAFTNPHKASEEPSLGHYTESRDNDEEDR